MKTFSLFSLVLLSGFMSLAQIDIDKPITMSGINPSDRVITNLAPPVNGTDAVNKDYVDAAVAASGGSVPWVRWQRFTSGGTFTVPAGVTLIKVQVSGAGGGGGANNGGSAGGGGGGGGFAEGTFEVVPSDTYDVTIGAGGAGGTSSSAGGNGGPSSFIGPGINISATGGSGGLVRSAGGGGAGGMGSGGYLNTTLGSGGNTGLASAVIPGKDGTNGGGSGGGGATGANTSGGGGGGGGVGGGNAGGGINQNGLPALPNTGAGGGGASGGSGSNSGGNGADGQVVIFW